MKLNLHKEQYDKYDSKTITLNNGLTILLDHFILITIYRFVVECWKCK